MDQLIEISDLHKTYELGEISVPVLRGITLSIRRGEFVALMGASGSGKSTLMNILGFLDRPSLGCYTFEGEDVSSLNAVSRAHIRNEKIGFIFQNFNLLKRTTALDNVVLPLQYSKKAGTVEAMRKLALEGLTRVGLADRHHHTPVQLSGGQQQRVAIARALINHPSIVLADEPTGNLDSTSSREILEILRKINQENGVTVIIVTHDAKVAQQAKRVLSMRDGLLEQA